MGGGCVNHTGAKDPDSEDRDDVSSGRQVKLISGRGLSCGQVPKRKAFQKGQGIEGINSGGGAKAEVGQEGIRVYISY